MLQLALAPRASARAQTYAFSTGKGLQKRHGALMEGAFQQWSDLRTIKVKAQKCHLVLWTHGLHYASRIQEVLERGTVDLPLRLTEVRHAKPSVERKKEVGKAKELGEDEGYALLASNCYEQPLEIVALLQACAKQKDLYKASKLHEGIIKSGLLERNICVGNTLINLYSKCGALAKAQQVFDELRVRNVVSWNALIAGYAQHRHGEEALNCFDRMQQEGLIPNKVTFVSILKACGNIGAAKEGKQIHVQIVKEVILENFLMVGNALIDMYAKCGVFATAENVFNQLQVRDLVSWNALISGYAQHGHAEVALTCYEQMQCEGFSPDAITFVCILKACGSIGATDKGKKIHAEIDREGLMEKDTLVGNALINMYAKCGALMKAQEVFDEVQVRDAVTWNALIAGYAHHGNGKEALNYFERMQCEGPYPDVVTLVCILKACGSIGAIGKGKELHGQIVREGLLAKNTIVGTALMDMYAKCGAPQKAHEVFNELQVRDEACWNALIAGYVLHGHGEEALGCFDWMRRDGVPPGTVTFVCGLKACGIEGAGDKGKEIHAEIIRGGLLEDHILVGTALVDMYAKCGAPEKAQEVFDKLPIRGVVPWTALIAGYAQLGKDDIAFRLFYQMIRGGVMPNSFTFTIVLNACSHSGLLDEGQMCFETMGTGYGIIPTLEHYACMVDLFCRAGHFDKALAVIRKMPNFDYLSVWTALLAGCQKCGEVNLGRLAFEHAMQLDDKDAAAYVCMGNIYTAAAMQEDADKIEAMRVKNKAWKMSQGSCWANMSGINFQV